jgi:type I restriction enzyme M protein
MSKKISETITENIFREFYGSTTFIEKNNIPDWMDFKSKKGTEYKGYPDFLKDEEQYVIVVEAKAINQYQAIEEVKHYLNINKIESKDLIGIAVSGQTKEDYQVSYFLKKKNEKEIYEIKTDNTLFTLENIKKIYNKSLLVETISDENLITILNQLNKTFHKDNRIKDTERSLFFSGLMIALKDNTFRNTYKYIESPTEEEISTIKISILESHNLNESILYAITRQLKDKINNLSKSYSWTDRFSFIKNVDFPLNNYKEIIKTIEDNIFLPFQNEEKQDILGKAYKIFLKKAGSIDNKNIILTPDHIKTLMVELSRLNKNDVVIDTCTGTGGFLMESMEVLIQKSQNNEEKIKNIKEKQLVGFEVDPVLFALTCSNMFLHGDGRSNLLYRSSLLVEDNQNIVNNKDKVLFEYVKSLKPTKCIINPPYENNNSILFTIQAIKYLEDNGKLVIIMPTTTLTNNVNGLTEKLLKNAKLDYVIKMPPRLFSEQKRTVETAIFGFTKTPHENNDEVIFYNLKDDGLVSVQHKGRLDKYNEWDNIKKDILDKILNNKESDNSIKLNIFNDKGEVDIKLLNGIKPKKDSKNKQIKISDVFNIEKGSLASDNSEDGKYTFITAGKEWKTNKIYTHDTEALIYAINSSGSLGRCHYINDKFIASNLCLILTKKEGIEEDIDLKFYNEYLNLMKEKIIEELSSGSSKKTINERDFSKYLIDYIEDKTIKEKFLKAIEEKNRIEKEFKKDLEEKKSIIKKLFTDIIK